MAKALVIDMQTFANGFYDLLDTTNAPYGSARIMKNQRVTDRGGVAPRQGTVILGSFNANQQSVRGLYNFKRSLASDEVLIKAYDAVLEGISKKYSSSGWFTLKTGLTQNGEFGFATTLVNVDNQDYVVMGNRFDDYMSWTGSVAKTTAPVLAGDLLVPVDSVLKPDAFEDQVATSNSATTVTVSAGIQWAADSWRNFYVYFPGSGKIRRITGNTVNTITFDTLGTGPGNVQFQVRQLDFDPYVTQTSNTIAFVASTPPTITDSANGFVNSGFRNGQDIVVSGSSGINNGQFRIKSVSAGTITLLDGELLEADAAGPSVTITTLNRVIYGGTEVTYTQFDLATQFETPSASVAPSGTVVAQAVKSWHGSPRGNRITNYLTRIIQGNIRSALAKDQGGAVQGYSSAGSYFVSSLSNPFDYDYSVPRLPTEGDIVATPYGGGDITDVTQYEDSLAIFKADYIELAKYSQDVDDALSRTPLKQGTGSVGKVIKGSDDIYFVTRDSKFTSLSRVQLKDTRPETVNLGYPIKRYLEKAGFGDLGRGIEWNDRLYIPIKSDPSQQTNDVTLVFNKLSRAFDGVWDIPSNFYESWNGKVYYGDSNGPNVFQMFGDQDADVLGDDDRQPIESQWASHFINTALFRSRSSRSVASAMSKSDINAMYGIVVEGYIRDGTTVTFDLWKDFAVLPFLTFDFTADPQFEDGFNFQAFLGSHPLGIRPMGALDDTEVDPEGWRHFSFRVYFPWQYGYYFSVGHRSFGTDFRYEITRYGLIIQNTPLVNQNRVLEL